MSGAGMPPIADQRLLINAGCGPLGGGRVPAWFGAWRQFRVDLDPTVQPDLVASITDLSGIPDEFADAVWSAHCLEHLYAHEVVTALGEFRRVLKPTGFLCLMVPDLQAAAVRVSQDQLHETLYESPAGPVTPHDMLFGFGPALARGHTHMAHRCGFTPTVLGQRLHEAGFAETVLRRRVAAFELAALGFKTPLASPAERNALMSDLGL